MGHGEFLWSDLATFDVASTLEFYHDVIGWTYRREPVAGGPDYYYAAGSGAAVAGIYEMPNVFRDGGMESFWMSYIGIDDIEAGIAQAVALGGSVVMGPARFGENAAIAMLRDPQGAPGQELSAALRGPGPGRRRSRLAVGRGPLEGRRPQAQGGRRRAHSGAGRTARCRGRPLEASTCSGRGSCAGSTRWP